MPFQYEKVSVLISRGCVRVGVAMRMLVSVVGVGILAVKRMADRFVLLRGKGVE